jgi:chromosome segregation ATPase
MADKKWKAEFDAIVKKTHTQQAIWWLNGFWDSGAKDEAQRIYDFVQTFKEIEFGQKVIERKGKGKELVAEYKEGCDLDEFKAHKFLESVGEVLTVKELRARLEAIDIDKNRKMALSEYLLFKYNKKPQQLCDAPQGGNEKELKAASDALAEVQTALADVNSKLESQRAALEAQKKAKAAAEEAKAAADKSLADQKAAEEVVRAAEAELKAAVDDLNKQEEDYKGRIATAEHKANDESLGAVQRNKAKNEVAQLKAEDPLPLRKAKITQEAALKRVQKERQKAEAATKVAEQKAAEATTAAEAAAAAEAELEQQTKQLEAAQADLQKKFDEAVEALNAVKKKGGGVAQGAIWWMEKELAEAKKYMGRK